MKLTDIDLNDKSEVSAAHALLAAILGHAVSDDIPGAPSLNQTTGAMIPTPGLSEDAARAKVLDAAAVFAQPGQLPPAAQPMQDAAAVFGAAPLSQAASSTAGAGQPLTAPGAMPASLPGLPASPAPAPYIAPGAIVPGGLAAMGQPAAPTSPAPSVELDSRGLPWDARIHASTKSKKKDGSWTALRGLNDEARVTQIEAELRASVAGTPTVAPAVPTQALPGLAISAGTPAAASDPVTFEALMPRVTQATISGILPPTALQQVCGTLGLPSVVALQTNPAFVPHAWAQLKAAYPALQ